MRRNIVTGISLYTIKEYNVNINVTNINVIKISIFNLLG